MPISPSIHSQNLEIDAVLPAEEKKEEKIPSLSEYSEYLRTKYLAQFARLKQDPDLPYDQATATCEAVWRLCKLPANHIFGGNSQVIAPTGAGKTYFINAVIELIRLEAPEKFPLNKFILIISPPAVQEQTREVLATYGGNLPGVIITTLAGLRTGGVGDMFIFWKTEMINGEPKLYPHWHFDLVSLIFVDESQQLKNESTQTDLMISAAKYGIPIIPLSATPYSRPCQARAIGIITAPTVTFGQYKVPIQLNEDSWASWIREVCDPDNPLDWSPSALERVQRWLDSKTIRFTCKYPYPIIAKYAATQFTSAASRQRYADAYEDWERKKAEFGKNPTTGFAAVLVAMAKHNQVADEERAPNTAEFITKIYREREGNSRKKPMSYILGFAFRTALDKAYAHLVNEMGWKEREIGIIAGGRGAANARDHKLFQRDKIHIMLMTVACGGAGLSLDHNKFNRRQRSILASATYNDIQMAQLAGRTQRVDTQSATYLIILYYEGTEEHRKIVKVRRKMSSLAKVVTRTGVKKARAGTNVFLDDHDELKNVSIRNLLKASGDDHLSEEEQEASEEAIAQRILGTQQEVEIVEADEDDEEQD